MESDRPNGARRRLPPWLLPVFGYTVSLACLIWVYKGFDWKAELPKLTATDGRWVTVAVLADIAVYVCQGWRWNLLLSPVARIPVTRTIQAIYIGLFANEVLPLRSGEVIRCYLQGRWSKIPFSVVFSSAVVERLMDGVWLIFGFYLVTHFVELPGLLVQGGKILAGILLVIAVLLMVAVLLKHHTHKVVSASRWSGVLWHVVEGVNAMGRSRTFWASFAVSLLYLALQVVPIYALFRGYGLDLSWWAGAVVLVILRLGSIPPQAPGNVGSFQFFTILGLRLFDVDRSEATAFATLLFVVVTVPLWLAGFIALVATRMKLDDIHRDAHTQWGPTAAASSRTGAE